MTEASPSGTTGKQSPFAPANVRLFIAFRIFFNCRFYYPVFTILFLDFGLTLDQFVTFWLDLAQGVALNGIVYQ